MIQKYFGAVRRANCLPRCLAPIESRKVLFPKSISFAKECVSSLIPQRFVYFHEDVVTPF